jgi:hypothetical protein
MPENNKRRARRLPKTVFNISCALESDNDATFSIFLTGIAHSLTLQSFEYATPAVFFA